MKPYFLENVDLFSARVACDAHECCCPRRRRCPCCSTAAGGWNLFGGYAERLLATVLRVEQNAFMPVDCSDNLKVPSL